MSALLKVRVAEVRQLSPVVREFTLVPVTGSLPGFSAGSHVLVHLPTPQRSLRNAYSLLGDPAALRVKVEALSDAIGPFRTVLGNFDLLSGAPRNAIVNALGAVEEILDGAEDLLRLQLVGHRHLHGAIERKLPVAHPLRNAHRFPHHPRIVQERATQPLA